jgi:hypothetical protein
MHTIPIRVAPGEAAAQSEAPRLGRTKLLRYAHLALAWLIALAPAGLALYAVAVEQLGLGLGGDVARLMQNPWVLGASILGLIFMTGHGVATCSPMSPIYGFGALGLASFVPSLLIPGGIVAVALYVGLTLSLKIYAALRAPHELPDACETRAELNPRCSTCHAKSFCPYQPGGIADRYTKQR